MLRKKRFICLFLIIGLCLALVPAAVAAEDPADVSEAALPQEDTGLVFSEDSILGAVLDGAEESASSSDAPEMATPSDVEPTPTPTPDDTPADPAENDDPFARKGVCGESTTWERTDEGILRISGTGAVTTAPWAAYAGDIVYIMIDEGVTTLCDKAFNGCTAVVTVRIPVSLTGIGTDAFAGCGILTSVSYSGTTDQWYAMDISGGNEALKTAFKSTLPAGGSCGENVTWRLAADGVMTISGSGTLTGDGHWHEYLDVAERIVIDTDVTAIAAGAFIGSGDVYYKGSEADWSGVSVSSDSGLVTYTVHFMTSSSAVRLDSGTGRQTAMVLSADDTQSALENNQIELEPGEDLFGVITMEAVVTCLDERAVGSEKLDIGEDEVLQYLDISVKVMKDDRYVGEVTETANKLRFSIVLPEAAAEAIGDRQVYVLRVHNGETERLLAEYAPATRTVTFLSDRFSTFAIAYSKDQAARVLGDVTGDDIIDLADLIRLLKYIGGDQTGGDLRDVGDVNGDGRINVQDLIRLMKYVNGQISGVL